jgi:hypothetical protein
MPRQAPGTQQGSLLHRHTTDIPSTHLSTACTRDVSRLVVKVAETAHILYWTPPTIGPGGQCTSHVAGDLNLKLLCCPGNIASQAPLVPSCCCITAHAQALLEAAPLPGLLLVLVLVRDKRWDCRVLRLSCPDIVGVVVPVYQVWEMGPHLHIGVA